MSLVGKVSLITGGAQGLGKMFGENVLEKGAKVCVADINEIKGETTVKDFTDRFGCGRALFVKCDVTSERDFENAFQRAKSEYGRIDIVCNNAGIADEERWRRTIDVNLVSVMQGTLLGIKHMRKDIGGEGGVIINISSTAGLVPVDFLPAYVASKTAVVAYTRSWAESPLNRKTGIRFCTLCPSYVPGTDIIKLSDIDEVLASRLKKALKVIGIMRPEVVAEAFMELVEDEHNNGAVLCVTKHHGKQYIPPPPKL